MNCEMYTVYPISKSIKKSGTGFGSVSLVSCSVFYFFIFARFIHRLYMYIKYTNTFEPYSLTLLWCAKIWWARVEMVQFVQNVNFIGILIKVWSLITFTDIEDLGASNENHKCCPYCIRKKESVRIGYYYHFIWLSNTSTNTRIQWYWFETRDRHTRSRTWIVCVWR